MQRKPLLAQIRQLRFDQFRKSTNTSIAASFLGHESKRCVVSSFRQCRRHAALDCFTCIVCALFGFISGGRRQCVVVLLSELTNALTNRCWTAF